MDTAKSTAPTTSRRGETEHMTIVPSFTSPGTSYVVKGESCTCGAAKYGKGCIKHIEVAPGLEKIESRPFSDAEKERHRERLISLATRLYSRPCKTETAASSYDLYWEVLAERFATEDMRERAAKRHNVVIERLEVAA